MINRMCLDELPDLCARLVLWHCSEKDACVARLVCKKWRAAVLRWKYRRVHNNAQFDALARCANTLRHLHTLEISGCTGITDVSALAGIHTLYMRGCTGITDIRALAGIHALYMSGCADITDVSALVGIRVLYITRTQEHRMQGIDALRAAGCTVFVW